MATSTRPSEELLAAPLPDLIRDLGLAVAEANEKLRAKSGDLAYTISSAEIEVKIVISVSKSTEAGAGAGGNLYGFALNASYKSTYGFKEEASSSIKIVLQAMPKEPLKGA